MKDYGRKRNRLWRWLVWGLILCLFLQDVPVVSAKSKTVGKAVVSGISKTAKTQVKLSWKKASGAQGYDIYMRKGKSGSFKKIKTVSSGKAGSFTVKKLDRKSVYYFRVQAFAKDGGTTIRGKLSDIKNQDMRNPITPVLKKAALQNNKAVALSWKKSADAKGYVIYRKTGSGKFAKLKAIGKAGTVKYTDKSVKAGKTYSYRILAVSGTRKSSYSKTLTVRVPKKGEAVQADSVDDLAKSLASMIKENKTANGEGAQSADEFYAKRLIVKTNGSTPDFSKYKATAAIKASGNVFFVQFAKTSDARAAWGELSNRSDVIYVEPDSCETGGAEEVYSSTAAVNSWGVSRLGADKLAQVAAKTSSAAMKVAVVDTGVSNHSFLYNRLSSDGYDLVDGDTTPADLNGHGTHVAGTIVDCTPDLTNIKIMPVRVLDGSGHGYASVIGTGIRYAVDHGAKVINMSLGGRHNQYKDESIAYAISKGVTVVVASGNEFGNTADFCPAHLSEVICVGAVNSNEIKADFSNAGSAVDVVAPGVDILSCYPGGSFKKLNGTSMAAPHVTALAAMQKLIHPNYTPAQIEQTIKSSCRDLGVSGRDDSYGWGIPDFRNASYTPPAVAVTGIALNRTSLSLTAGSSSTLTATISPSNASNKTVTWSSSNSGVATVSSGTVTARAAGTATITARSNNGKTASCTVTVTAPAQPAWRWSDWSSWTTTPQSSSGDVEVQTKTQYRYRDKSFASSTSPSMSGWTQYSSSTGWSAWGNWSNWGWTAYSANDSTQVETMTVWRYYAFVCPTCGVREPFSGKCDYGHPTSSGNWQETWMPIPYSSCGSTPWPNAGNKSYTYGLGDGLLWNFSTGNLYDTAPGTQDASGPSATVIGTHYRYRTRSIITTYNFYCWGSWSSWSDTAVTGNSNREVGTQKLYRTRRKIYN